MSSVEDEAPMTPRRRLFFQRKWTFLDIRLTVIVLVLHFLCLMAPFQFTWPAFWVALALDIMTGLFGITLSYHRHLTHKSFKLPKWLEYTFAYMGVLGFQGDPIDWVSTHRYHHKFVETERDPHSPTQDGFWFAQVGWALDSHGLTKKVCPKYIQDFEEKDGKFRKYFNNMFMIYIKHGKHKNVEELHAQAFYRFLRKTYLLHHFALALFLYAVGGLPFVIWGMGVRIVFMQHSTSFVNSICHMYGSKQWHTGDQSRNNWVVALVTFGEGWHNNHHAFEYSARHGLEWWQFDATWFIILFLEALGLATDLKLPSKHHMEKLAIK